MKPFSCAGSIHLAKRELQKAIEDFRKVLELNPDLSQAHHQLALAYALEGNADDAREEFNKVLEINPRSKDAVLQLSELEIKTGNAYRAIELLNKYVKKFGDIPLAYVLLGTAYSAEKRLDEALDAFEEASSLAPKDPRGKYLMGVVMEAQGKVDEARRVYEASLDILPDYVAPLSRLVAMEMKQGNFDGGR